MNRKNCDIILHPIWLAALVAVAWLLEQLVPARTGPDVVMAVFNFWVQLAVMIVSAIISYALAPKPPSPKPAALADFDAPTAEEGRPIPVVFGTVWIKGPNVLWYGDLRSVPIKKKGGKK
ncbi:hypothetical protein [Arenimonas fontis]|nr:hypothetical protein [Arenimonas fontis]